MKVFISGQKYFGESVYFLCKKMGFDIVGVCAPIGDKYLYAAAVRDGVPIIPAGTLNSQNMPPCDLGITAHSFDYIGKKTRYIPKYGWLGYHPSLLPRHRGRSAVEWAIRMGDSVTGGTIFWLNGGIDRGDIAKQDFCFIPKEYILNPKRGASDLWREKLCGMGIKLYEEVLTDVKKGVFVRVKQDKRFSTFEPSLDNIKDVYKPDLLMIPYYDGVKGDIEREAEDHESDYIPHH